MAVAPTTPDDMKERIRRACTKITPQMLAEVRRSLHLFIESDYSDMFRFFDYFHTLRD